MKHILILIFASMHLFALNIILNSGKEKHINYALLHIIDTKPLICETILGELEKKKYLCKFDRPVNQTIESKKMALAELDFYEKNNEFYVAITPKVDSKLIPIEENLFDTTEILSHPKVKEYKHWLILLQENSLYEDKKVVDSLDFPVVYEKYKKPYVGALDLNGAPISYAQSKDIQLYLDIKRDYEKGDYENILKNSRRVLTNYPYSIFKSELEMYSIRAMDKLLSAKGDDSPNIGFDENDMVMLAKQWTKEFASDENIPEVFMILAKTYLKMGLNSDANYLMDILVSEHTESSFTKKAILIFADNLFAKKKKDEALKLYLDVLYSAQDLDIASEAAIRLSDHQMNAGKIKEAREYLLKVLGANEQYLLKDKDESHRLARRLFEHKLYDVAAKVSDLLLEGMSKKDENHELLLKESGDWHAKADEAQVAYARYQSYLADYKNSGDYVEGVTSSLDELFFKLNETNETKLVQYYDKLIENYSNNIGEKALIEKAKLLLKQKKFDDVLLMKEALLKASDIYGAKPEELIYDAAKSLSFEYLKTDQCQAAIALIEEYKVNYETGQEEDKRFDCFMRFSRYEMAKEISSSHLKDSSLESRLIWAQKEITVLYGMGKYKEVIAFKGDIIKLSQTLKKKPALEALRDIFFSTIRIKKTEEALVVSDLIEQNYPNSFTNIDIYYEIVKMAGETKNDLLLIKYAQMVIKLQQESKTSTYSPNIELSYIDALKRMGKTTEALGVVENALAQKFDTKDLIRLLYNAGEISLKLNNDNKAKEYFGKCIDNNETSSWKNICAENLKLF